MSNFEDLSKHQLILLTLLVSFITSIATGIITFTLLSQAPVEVTQNINRVVERTIEKVVPEVGKPATTVTTVVVNEEDRVLDSISKNEKSIVRLKTQGADGTPIIAGLGLVISSDGTIVSDIRSYNSASTYSVTFYDDKTYLVSKIYQDTANGLVFMKVNVPVESPKYTFYPSKFGDSNGLNIGQTLVVISGRDSNAASIGRIYQLIKSEDKSKITSILSDIKVSRAHIGSPALNLSGEVVGIEAPLSESDVEYSYTPINIIKAATPKALEELSK